MTATPESPLEKKVQVEEETLTVEERVTRLEMTLERAFNVLGNSQHDMQMQLAEEKNHFEGELSQTLTLMNISTLQNVIALREVTRALIAKGLVDAEALDKVVQEELHKAIQAQQKAVQEAQNALLEKAAGATEEAKA